MRCNQRVAILLLSILPMVCGAKASSVQKKSKPPSSIKAGKHRRTARAFKPKVIRNRDVYLVSVKANLIADALLHKKNIHKWQKIPELESSISTTVTFQLNLAVIELLHHYELDLKMHPIPIVTSSPIKYYPADVMFLTKLVTQRMQAIAKRLKIDSIPARSRKRYPKYNIPRDIYRQTFAFYMKLLSLTGYKEITPDQTYSQLFRARRELKNIVFSELPKITDKSKKRILAASLYGANPYGGKPLTKTTEEKTVQDIFNRCLDLRKQLIPLLERASLKPLPLPTYPKDYKAHSVDVFVQSQIIIAELSEWKRILGVGTSTPVTVQFEHKSLKDVYQEIKHIDFILDKIAYVLKS